METHFYVAARTCSWLCGRVRGCADVFVAVRTCLWLRGCVRGCADVFVAVRTCSWLRGRVRDRWPKTGTGGRGLSGLGQRCGELIANSD